MSDLAPPKAPSAAELERMHALYREGGAKRAMAPHAIYADDTCPHAGCDQRLQGIDFRVAVSRGTRFQSCPCVGQDWNLVPRDILAHRPFVIYGAAVHDPLVRAWWADVGFAGRCPKCSGWIHFTIRGKRAVTAEEASALPKLPDDWADTAIIL